MGQERCRLKGIWKCIKFAYFAALIYEMHLTCLFNIIIMSNIYNKSVYLHMQQTANMRAESSGGWQSGKNGFIT